jgi:uncharacterized protein (UPF0371 family)
MKIGFDIKKYLEEQSTFILERVNDYDKLYLEFGGKLMFDMHAKRVLPGFDENAKIKLLQQLKDKLEVVICVYAGDIERNKMRGDFGITYDMDLLRLIDDLRENELDVNSVVITRYNDQPAVTVFINKLERRGIRVYTHRATPGYPFDVDTIVSEEGYGKNPYIETTKPIVVVTAPGPGSGKLATCLSQMYHEHVRGVQVGYSKFETFPVWNLPLKHPVNIAYEAATVDLKDVNMIDAFHLEAYNEVAINYNRDIETFPVLKRIIEKITGTDSVFKSPTDMGVNRVGYGIIDDEVIRKASIQEIIRRYFKTGVEYKKGYVDYETFQRSLLIMEELNLKQEDRAVVMPARAYLEDIRSAKNNADIMTTVAIELKDGTVILGKESRNMNAAAAVIINAIKHLANLSEDLHLLSPVILEPILHLKINVMGSKVTTLNSDEILIALSMSAVTNPTAKAALDMLPRLKGTQAHATTIFNGSDEQTFRSLGIDMTCDAVFQSESLYYNS